VLFFKQQKFIKSQACTRRAKQARTEQNTKQPSAINMQ